MKLFFDIEFTGLHQKTTLISLGITAENEETFYAEFNDFDENQIDDWLQNNVLNKLINYELIKNKQLEMNKTNNNFYCVGNTDFIKQYLIDWINKFNTTVEMWSDCLAYDWVLFNNIFGTAFDIPKNIYYIPFDICTLFKIKGIDPDINREEFCEMKINSKFKHNSLWDSLIIKHCYDKLIMLE